MLRVSLTEANPKKIANFFLAENEILRFFPWWWLGKLVRNIVLLRISISISIWSNRIILPWFFFPCFKQWFLNGPKFGHWCIIDIYPCYALSWVKEAEKEIDKWTLTQPQLQRNSGKNIPRGIQDHWCCVQNKSHLVPTPHFECRPRWICQLIRKSTR